MRTSTAVLSRNERRRLFSRGWLKGPWQRAKPRARRGVHQQHGYAAAEVMEPRELLSATFGSALSIGNDAGETKAFDVATDAAGNSYMTGYFQGTVDFDPGAGTTNLTARGAGDAFVAKYAPNNSLLWVQRMGGDAAPSSGGAITDIGRRVAVDGSGNVYVAGDFLDSGDFGSSTLNSLGGRDGFVAKLHSGTGAIQWAALVGTVGDDYGKGVGVDSSGNVYTLNAKSDSWNGGYDVSKFSSTGNPIWTKSIVTLTNPGLGDMAVSASGNVFVVGNYGTWPGSPATDFDPSPTKSQNVSGNGGFVLKLDTNGKFGWVSPFVGQTVGSTFGQTLVHAVALDGSGNVVVGGSYSGSVDFNPGTGKGQVTTLPTIGGGFVTKLNSSGGLVWAKALEDSSATTGDVSVYSVAVDAAGGIYATGPFSGTVDVNPGAAIDTRTSAGGNDIYVVKLTAAGNYSWAETFGGTADDFGTGIALDPTGGVHLVGFYSGTVDFDPDPLTTYVLATPGAFANAFRLRLGQV